MTVEKTPDGHFIDPELLFEPHKSKYTEAKSKLEQMEKRAKYIEAQMLSDKRVLGKLKKAKEPLEELLNTIAVYLLPVQINLQGLRQGVIDDYAEENAELAKTMVNLQSKEDLVRDKILKLLDKMSYSTGQLLTQITTEKDTADVMQQTIKNVLDQLISKNEVIRSPTKEQGDYYYSATPPIEAGRRTPPTQSVPKNSGDHELAQH
jgi:hypothetical protein